MLIGGLQKMTLIDYPGKIAATVFTAGCNFSCPFCFTANNYLLTDKGRMSIKEIVGKRLDCLVYDSEGELSQIKNYFSRNADKILRIRAFLNSEVIECTPNHKLLVYDSAINKIILKKAESISRENDYLTISVPSKSIDIKFLNVMTALKASYFSRQGKGRFSDEEILKRVQRMRKDGRSWRQIYKELGVTDHVRRVIEKKEYLDSKILPDIKTKNNLIAMKGSSIYFKKEIKITSEFLRLVGYYLSEGCVSKKNDRRNSYYISFTFNKKEAIFIKDVKNIFYMTFGIKLNQRANKKNNTITLLSHIGIVAIFFKYYFGSNSHDKELPANFIYLLPALQEELIRGLFRGDGITSENYIKKYRLQRIQITSPFLLLQISLILYRLGVRHSRFRKEIIIKDKRIFHILGQENLLSKKTINTSSRYGFLDKDYAYLKISSVRALSKKTKVYNLEMGNASHTYNVSLINVSNCHNPELVQVDKYKDSYFVSEPEFFDFLKKRHGMIEGVCVTGGEPTLHSDLIDFLKKVKSLGFLVKLDTNGSRPEILKEILGSGAVDYLAMDIKGPLEKYHQIVRADVDFEKIHQSTQLLRQFPDYEFRTTVVPGLHKRPDFLSIARWLEGARRYYLQQFRSEDTLDPDYVKIKPYSDQKLGEFCQMIKPYFEICEVRT